jgi:diguanylate cyclase (GGDEF)-like protein/PAS domain S-box-containing protein
MRGGIFLKNSPGKSMSKKQKRSGKVSVMVNSEKRVKSSQSLLASPEIFDALINTTSYGIYMVQDGKFVFVSPQFTQGSGYEEEELLGKDSLSRVYQEDREYVRRCAIDCLKGRRTEPYEYRFRHKDGKLRWILEKVATAEIDGKRVAVASFMDITEYKEMEETTAAYKEFNTLIIDESPYPVSLIAKDATIKYVNRSFEELTGYSSGELLNKKPPYPYWFRDDHKRMIKSLKAAFKTGLNKEEGVYRNKSGTRFWVELTATTIDNGNTLFSTYIDITQRKTAEFALMEERDKAQKYLDVADVILMAMDRSGNVTMINNKGCEILGYSEDEIIGKNWFKNFLPAKYRTSVKNRFKQFICEDLTRSEYSENPVLTKQCTERIIAWHSTLLQNEQKEIVGTICSGEDITERVRTEQNLKESELKYRVLTDSSLTGIFIHQNNKYVYVNEQFARMHGYHPQELIGKNCMMLMHPEDKQKVRQHLKEVMLRECDSYRGEIRSLKKHGGTIWCQMIVTNIEYRKKPALMGNVIDLTERKNMETDLSLKAKMLDEATDSILVHDEDRNIIYVNDVATKLCGYSMAEMMNMKMEKLIVPEQRWIFTSQLPDLFEQGRLTIQVDIINKDGYILTTEMHSRVIELKDKKMVINIAHDITARQKAEEELLAMATHDLLTGLPNRGLLNDRMNMALASAERNKNEMAVMMLDLDRFKNVNDKLGHDVGDSLLKETAERLAGLLRRSDTIARLGGDEFFVLLPEIKSVDDASVIATKVVHAFRRPFVIGHHSIGITASVGVAVYPYDGTNSDTLTRNADKAMYAAKDKGKNTYELYMLLKGKSGDDYRMEN